MGQSKFKWIFVMEDGETIVVEATWDYLMDAWYKTPQFQMGCGPVAIIRGEFA